MNTNDLNTALYEKMAAEQDKYRDWLKSQPPEEILHHTYEYTVREDIVMAMEDSGTSRHCAYLVVDEVNLGLTDLFTRQARKTLQEPEKGSVLQKLKQEPTTHKPALSKKQEPER